MTLAKRGGKRSLLVEPFCSTEKRPDGGPRKISSVFKREMGGISCAGTGKITTNCSGMWQLGCRTGD
jgi:hypothetical protein